MAQLSRRIIEWGWLLVAAATPIFINPWGYQPVDPAQAAFLRSVVLAMAAAALIGWLEGRRNTIRERLARALPEPVEGNARPFVRLRRIRERAFRAISGFAKRPLLVPVGVLAALAILSTVFSVNPGLSLWGSYPWRHGLYTVLSMLLLFVFVARRLEGWPQVRRLMKAMAWGSAPVVAYALAQAVGLDPIPWERMEIGVFSTLGRSNFLGAYLVEVIPITGVLAILAPKGAPRAGYLTLVAGQLAALTLSQARAAWLGLFLGVLAAAFILGWRWRRRRLWLSALAASGAGLLTLATVNLAPAAFPGLAQMPYLGRLATFNPIASASVAGRLVVWPAAASLAAERPFTGYGPETLYTIYTARYSPELVYYLGRNAEVDRTHNYFLDLALASGIPATLTALALFGLLAFLAVRHLWRSADRREQLVAAGCLAAILGYLAQNQFSFWTVAPEAIFWLLAAMVVALPGSAPAAQSGGGVVRRPELRSGRRTRGTGRAPRPVPPSLLHRTAYLFVAGVAAAALIWSNGLPLLADVYLARAVVEKDPSRALSWASQAASSAPQWAEYPFLAAGRYLNLAERSSEKVPLLEHAEAEMQRALTLVPGYYRHWAALGQIYTYWGREVDPEKFATAHDAYRRALELFPNGSLVWVGLGDLYQSEGDGSRAEESYRRALELDATQSLAYRGLAQLYLNAGDRGRAIQELVNATILEPGAAGLWELLGRLYLAEGKTEEAAQALMQAEALRARG